MAAFGYRSDKEAYRIRQIKRRVSAVQFVNNEPEQIELRKSRDTLIVVGTGTVLFGIWTLVKMLSLLFLLREETVEAILNITGPIEELSDRATFWILTVFITLFMLLLLSVRTYVGLCAIAVGRGKRRGMLYIFLACLMVITGTWTFCSSFFTLEAPEQLGALTRNQSFSALIIDATSIIMLAQMVVSALKIRKLTGTERIAKD